MARPRLRPYAGQVEPPHAELKTLHGSGVLPQKRPPSAIVTVPGLIVRFDDRVMEKWPPPRRESLAMRVHAVFVSARNDRCGTARAEHPYPVATASSQSRTHDYLSIYCVSNLPCDRVK